jgi:hypothetical protein
MTQILYAHVNKIKIKKKQERDDRERINYGKNLPDKESNSEAAIAVIAAQVLQKFMWISKTKVF